MNGYAFTAAWWSDVHALVFASLGQTTTSWTGPSRTTVRSNEAELLPHRAAVAPFTAAIRHSNPTWRVLRGRPRPLNLHHQFGAPCSNLARVKDVVIPANCHIWCSGTRNLSRRVPWPVRCRRRPICWPVSLRAIRRVCRPPLLQRPSLSLSPFSFPALRCHALCFERAPPPLQPCPPQRDRALPVRQNASSQSLALIRSTPLRVPQPPLIEPSCRAFALSSDVNDATDSRSLATRSRADRRCRITRYPSSRRP
jgi:hypothetical protein